MSRQEFNLTVNTGGEEGQILDHLLCARDPNVRHRDAKDLLKLVGNLRSRIAELDAERDRLRKALREMVGRDVDTCIAAECRDVPRLRRAEWCSSCIAREALGEAKP